MEATNSGIEERGKRPIFLLVLCILSFAWLGLGVSQGLMAMAQGPNTHEEIQLAQADLDQQIADLEKQGAKDWTPTFEKLKHMVIVMNDNFYAVQILAFLIYGLGLAAVIMMLRLLLF